MFQEEREAEDKRDHELQLHLMDLHMESAHTELDGVRCQLRKYERAMHRDEKGRRTNFHSLVETEDKVHNDIVARERARAIIRGLGSTGEMNAALDECKTVITSCDRRLSECMRDMTRLFNIMVSRNASVKTLDQARDYRRAIRNQSDTFRQHLARARETYQTILLHSKIMHHLFHSAVELSAEQEEEPQPEDDSEDEEVQEDAASTDTE